MAEVVSGVALKIGFQIFSRVTPKGFAWVRSKWVGRDILVIGQPRAGKTSLVRYIQYGLFAEAETTRTRAIKKTAAFTVKIGRNESLALEVRKAIDTVGQVSAAEHAELAKAYRPHVLVVVLDLSGPWEGRDERSARYYLEEFFEYFAEAFKGSYLVRRKLRAVFVVLNKRDKVDEKKASTWLKKAKDILKEQLRSLGTGIRDPIVVESSLVEDFDDGRSVNAIIQKIALKLEEG
jgi:GTPase SAR1 family protein